MAKIHPGQHIHLVGIGGAGLSAIARILLGQGYIVSGSDRSTNSLTDALARDGAAIYQGHDARFIEGADALIITSAVQPDHVEVAAARERGIPVYKRQDMIADLMEGKKVIAVAGTHGKTTTTSMVVHILRECGADPSYIVGGVMGNTGTNAGVGTGEYFVIEADEYDNMFHGLRPNAIILTSIEYDHPDFFKTEAEMIASFEHFLDLIDNPDGLVICADDPIARKIAERRGCATYGLRDGVVLQGRDVQTDKQGFTVFNAVLAPEIQSKGTRVRLPIPGLHNVRNALGALFVAPFIGESTIEDCGAAALETFKPAGRRFNLRGEVDQIAVIDDYAHHPTAIRVTLEAARQRYPDRQIWAVWQPHTFSRTQALMDDYRKAFDAAHHVLVTDIYAAREQPVPGVTSAVVVAGMKHPDARHTATFDDTLTALREGVKSPAAIIIMSAGDAPQIGIDYLKWLQKLD